MSKLWRSAIIAALLALTLVVVVEARPGPTAEWPKPSAPDAVLPAGEEQLGAESESLPASPAVTRIEGKIRHDCFGARPQGAYTHAVVARTVKSDGSVGATLHWGVIVLSADGNNAACPAGLGGGSMGWGRSFIVVRDANGNLLYSKLSRAGEANPPPGASSDSGGSPDGYVFAIRRVNNTWKFYFDGILKGEFNAPGVRVDKAYFLAESSGGALIWDRVAHVAFRAWPGGLAEHSNWWQPAAMALYNPSSNFVCKDADLTRYDNNPSDGITYTPHWGFAQSLRVGDSHDITACNYSDGQTLWPRAYN